MTNPSKTGLLKARALRKFTELNSALRKRRLLRALRTLKGSLEGISGLDDGDYAEFCRMWHDAIDALKDGIYAGPAGGAGRHTREEFENLWGAQSTIFMADILPYLHRELVANYRRKQVLKVLDVGVATGYGSRFLASLHSDHSIYSRMEVEALDVNPTRKRWVEAMAPNVEFRVQDLFELPSNTWDMVICSHVVEHLANPREFIGKLRDICKGFAFVYAPYDENPRIAGHLSTITEKTYEGLPCKTHLIKSMGWHPNRPEDFCILAVIDCRQTSGRAGLHALDQDAWMGNADRTVRHPGQEGNRALEFPEG
jgi:SAM-dependent methyltransferase